jgi:Kinesin motor domain
MKPASLSASYDGGTTKRRTSLITSSRSYRPVSCNLTPNPVPPLSPSKRRMLTRRQPTDSLHLSKDFKRLSSTDSSLLQSIQGGFCADDLIHDEIPPYSSLEASRESTTKNISRTFDDCSESGDCDLNSTHGSTTGNEKSMRTHPGIGTNVYVLCRMRPLVKMPSLLASSTSSQKSFALQSMSTEDENENEESDEDDDDEVEECGETVDGGKRLYNIRGNQLECYDEYGYVKGSFEFSKVFSAKASQKTVFSNPAIRDILESLFLGFNGTIFTYGQTNAGKTYTMEGKSLRNRRTRGLIPRSISYIFETIYTIQRQLLKNRENAASLSSTKSVDSSYDDDQANNSGKDNNCEQHIEFTVSVSFYEIYCEKIRDILNPVQDNMRIRETKTDGFLVQDLTEIACKNEEEMLGALERGKNNRSTAATLMNAYSSRSHSIFCITIRQRVTVESKERTYDFESHPDSPRSACTDTTSIVNTVVRKSRLFLVDLAGSEKVSQTGAEGDWAYSAL